MKRIIYGIILMVLCTAIFLGFRPKDPSVLNQVQTDTVRFEKGRALSILIGIMKSDAMQARGSYIDTIFPIARRYEYDPGVAFNVLEPTRGNYHPGFVAIASWPDLSYRTRFRNDPEVPGDMDDQRRRIWSRFDQLFFEDIKKPIAFPVREDRVYIFTAYWIEDPTDFNKYHYLSTTKMSEFSGKVLVELEGGISPKNHLYDPDMFMISEWKDANSFKRYLKELNDLRLEDGTKNINEFITSYVFGF